MLPNNVPLQRYHHECQLLHNGHILVVNAIHMPYSQCRRIWQPSTVLHGWRSCGGSRADADHRTGAARQPWRQYAQDPHQLRCAGLPCRLQCTQLVHCCLCAEQSASQRPPLCRSGADIPLGPNNFQQCRRCGASSVEPGDAGGEPVHTSASRSSHGRAQATAFTFIYALIYALLPAAGLSVSERFGYFALPLEDPIDK